MKKWKREYVNLGLLGIVYYITNGEYSILQMPCGRLNGNRWVICPGLPEWSKDCNFVWADNAIKVPGQTLEIVSFATQAEAKKFAESKWVL